MAQAAMKPMVAAVMLGMAALAMPAYAAPPKPNPAIVAEKADDMTMGSDTAPITLIEYGSVTCRHCAIFRRDIMPRIAQRYIDTGKVRYIYREMLTPPVDVSAAGILIARCAGKDQYFNVIDAVMRSQEDMFADGTASNARPIIEQIAQDAGLSTKQFYACIVDVKAQARLFDNAETYLTEHGVDDVPVFFINGVRFERETGDFAEFERAFAATGVE